ncbi:thioredoxin family protein [Bacillus siamensis]|uniref:thioredoxin family protein n=1 Tax=Bacillus siamensis TaxID=659243 RepID=UPI002E1BA872|nr:thioredoxin family protein [Bacillus siamensis]MED5097494.1 thioredoxin family protein [Bacillus siamensis]
MKTILVTLCVIVGLFIGLQYYVSAQRENINGLDTPYKKEKIHYETAKLLKNNDYQRLILPKDLENSLRNHSKVFVYFYSSTCTYCKKATPIVNLVSEKTHNDVKQFNLLEFEEGWNKYKIEQTPTLILFKNNKEVKRLEGLYDEKTYLNFMKN